jgi:hypothetical protein
MTREDVKEIIRKERLTGYNFFENRDNVENEIVVVIESKQWIVYATDERASKITGAERTFDNEESALDNFVKRLRALNALNQ